MLVALYMPLGNQGYVHARAAGSTVLLCTLLLPVLLVLFPETMAANGHNQ